jgi:hypothetical protein
LNTKETREADRLRPRQVRYQAALRLGYFTYGTDAANILHVVNERHCRKEDAQGSSVVQVQQAPALCLPPDSVRQCSGTRRSPERRA